MAQCVYFIQAESGGPIKIGRAADLPKRLKSLQIGSGLKLTVLAARPGGHADEVMLHSLLRAHRLDGEWFSPHSDVLRAVEGAKTGAPIGKYFDVAADARRKEADMENLFLKTTFSSAIIAAYGQLPGWRARAAKDAGVSISCISLWVKRAAVPHAYQIMKFAHNSEQIQQWALMCMECWRIAGEKKISVFEALVDLAVQSGYRADAR